MKDFLTPPERSARMASIRGKDTKPELAFRKALYREGFRYRVHVKRLPGTPDIHLARYKAVVMVNGCFWHGHSCQEGRRFYTRPAYWRNKILGNKKRDARKRRALRKLGLVVLTVWECRIATRDKRGKEVARVAAKLRQGLKG